MTRLHDGIARAGAATAGVMLILGNGPHDGSSGFPSLLLGVTGLVVVVGIVIFNLSGNRRTRTADPATVARALALRPEDGKAGLYLVRRGFLGRAQGIDFSINDVARGQIRGNQFLQIDLDPGRYHIDARGKGNAGATDVTLAAGEVAIFKVTIAMAMTAGVVTFTPMPVPQGKLELAGATLIRWDE